MRECCLRLQQDKDCKRMGFMCVLLFLAAFFLGLVLLLLALSGLTLLVVGAVYYGKNTRREWALVMMICGIVIVALNCMCCIAVRVCRGMRSPDQGAEREPLAAAAWTAAP